MPLGRGAQMGLGFVGVAGLLTAAGLAMTMAPSGAPVADPDQSVTSETSSTPENPPAQPLTARAGLLAQGDVESLVQANHALRATSESDQGESDSAEPLTEDQLNAWLDDLAGLGSGFRRFGPVDRSRVMELVGVGLDRMTVSPVPDRWIEALTPSAELLTVGLADASPAVRAGAAEVLGRVWAWQPGAPIWPDAERTVATWKNRLHTPLVALLDDPEPGVRLATVIALGKLPIDAMAEPAVARIADDVPAVRMQVLTSFAHRRDVLTDDAVLPLLFDPESPVALAAQFVLKARGLDDDLIGLAKLLYHPRADLRASAISQIERRDDIDPIVWLDRLSRDEDETVRSKAMEALSRLASPDARRRVAEMAASDPSPTIRDAARRVLDDLTADLPPLPGAPDLYPRAN
ncbi:HEAT repeat domain-containing protein [Tautonia marina]|uniref:HEAT repeat domain-containing protein n=1 Tax=Tautonia marina TaxID=2653855 RepID=UPI0012606C23|nr:HEAT repeat domain-containing protein [Tautonia marina]